jgi:hypothetical protein
VRIGPGVRKGRRMVTTLRTHTNFVLLCLDGPEKEGSPRHLKPLFFIYGDPDGGGYRGDGHPGF